MEERKIYASIHTHSKDECDSDNPPVAFCNKMAEYGAEGFVLTQHGVFSGVEPMRKAAAAAGLKFVPGIEAYYNAGDGQRRHLILISKDDTGYRVLGHAATEGNDTDGKAVLTEELLRKYFAPGCEGHSHVIATSACIQGVVAMELRKNDSVTHVIEKNHKKQSRYSDALERLQPAEAKLQKLDEEISANKAEKDAAKKEASAKFGARERQIAKLRAKGEDVSALEKELASDVEKRTAAAAKLEELTKDGKKLARRRSALNAEVKELRQKAERWEEIEQENNELRKQLLPEEALIAEAEKQAAMLQSVFGKEDFYMEVQYHGIDTEAYVYPKLVQIARKLGIPLVASNDIHMIDNSEDEILKRRILRSLRFGNSFEDLHPGDDQLYIKTDEELKSALVEILSEAVADEAIANIRQLFDRCNVEFRHEEHYPKFPVKDVSADDLLEREAVKGIAWRFPNGFPDERYEKRLRYELDIIKSMGYSNYHLVVKDYLEYGRELGAVPKNRIDEAPFDIEELKAWKEKNHWKVGFSIGPGRGSAVGSLVCYLLGITALDPIKYDLLFERFLNPERVSMPDIDSDFSNTIRQKVIEYVEHKYGKDSVCGIMTTNAQAPRGTVRIAAKYYGYSQNKEGTAFLSLADTIAKKIPMEPGISFSKKGEDGVTLYERLCNDYKENPDALEILRWARIIEGIFTAYGAHAAGIVISDGTPIKNHIPLRWNNILNEWTTQMDMVSVEENGFLKMDFLGLRTLDIITECIQSIEKTHGVQIDPLQIPLDDKNVYKDILCAGKTNSVFQFESSGMKNMLQRFQPSRFEDLIILVAMFRPGPLQYLDNVIDVKHGKPAEYITDKLKPILSETYGAIVFQEQVMQIFQELAGYTLGGADQVRRAMSKKKLKVLEAERPIFVNGIDDGKKHIVGCVRNGISEEAANKLFDQMTDFARYAFNKSHAAVYALIGYYTAWLKYHYPAEFLMAAMNWASLDGIPGLMQEARKLGVKVNAPDVNYSESGFSVHDGEILFGLGSVKSVGSTGDEIIEERKKGQFNSFAEFFLRVNAKKNAVENLIHAGAFDAFGSNRAAMIESIATIQELTRKLAKAREKLSASEKALTDIEALDEDMCVKYQFEKGFVAEGKKPKTKAAFTRLLESRCQSAKEQTAELKGKLGGFKLPDVEEDVEERMDLEHKYLGAYVTSHPLDNYDDSRYRPIIDAESGKAMFFGIIHDLRIKERKSDRKPMAFFVLEDRSGEIECCVFTKQYERLHGKLEEGAVIVASGNVQTEERNDVRTMKLFVEEIAPAVKKMQVFRIAVPSFYRFVLEKEKEFKKKYACEHGHPFYVYDTLTGMLRHMNYCVSDAALTVKEV